MYMNNWRIIVSSAFVRMSLRLMYVYVLVWRHEKAQHKRKERGICSDATHCWALCSTRHHSSTKMYSFHEIDDDDRTQSRATSLVWYCHEYVHRSRKTAAKAAQIGHEKGESVLRGVAPTCRIRSIGQTSGKIWQRRSSGF
jgi:hypothetical protein